MEVKNLLQNKVEEFFNTHPDDNIVYSALGNLFTEKEKAQKYLGGVSGRYVVTHTRDGVEHEKPSDKIMYEIADQENKAGDAQLAYENARPIDKEAKMGQWKAAQVKLAQMKSELDKQLKREEHDEVIARSEKEMNIKSKPLTREQLEAKISAQNELIKGTEDIFSNENLNGAKRKDAEKVLTGQLKELEDLVLKLSSLPSEETAPVVVEETTPVETEETAPVVVEEPAPVETEEPAPVVVEEPAPVKAEPASEKKEIKKAPGKKTGKK